MADSIGMIGLYRLFVITGFLLFVSSCALAPGMEVGLSADSDEVIHDDFDGIPVSLYAISPEMYKSKGEMFAYKQKEIPEDLFSVKAANYILGPHDVVVVTVWEHPELTQPMGQYRTDEATGQKIANDGTMYYPFIGKVKVAGLTPVQLRERLTKRLGKILQNPQIDVKVLAYRSKKIYVGGEVVADGTHFISAIPLTIPGAINMARGLNPNADGSSVYLTRDGKTHILDLISLYRDGSDLDKIYLKDGDKLWVPSRDENKVYVLGEVNSTKSIPMMHGRLSLAQALGEAGGIDQKFAEAGSIYVLRSNEKKEIEVYHLSIANPLSIVVSDQFNLKPRDIVYVDATGLARWNRVVSLLMPTINLLNQATAIQTGSQGSYDWWAE